MELGSPKVQAQSDGAGGWNYTIGAFKMWGATSGPYFGHIPHQKVRQPCG